MEPSYIQFLIAALMGIAFGVIGTKLYADTTICTVPNTNVVDLDDADSLLSVTRDRSRTSKSVSFNRDTVCALSGVVTEALSDVEVLTSDLQAAEARARDTRAANDRLTDELRSARTTVREYKDAEEARQYAAETVKVAEAEAEAVKAAAAAAAAEAEAAKAAEAALEERTVVVTKPKAKAKAKRRGVK